MSSMKTSVYLAISQELGSLKTLFMTTWDVARAMVRPNSNTLNWWWPNGVLKAVFGLSGRKERKEKTMPFGVSLMRSQVLYRAAQASGCNKI